ncbi:MAG: aldo/keto reductase [Deltaproteobacteria bacterium]|nr:aldo/keto reductase [Deltaproteobacteria bacterium]
MVNQIERRSFGNTGHMSSRAIFGSFSVGHAGQEEADHVLETILKYGINHIDTAPSYGDAEIILGNWMKQYRNHFFLATKIDKRSYIESKDQFYRSLDRLQTDHVDLLQIHNFTDVVYRELVMGPGGALEFLMEAQAAGLTRFIGITGHGAQTPLMHFQSLQRFDFNSVLLPCNYMMMQIPHYREHFDKLVRICKKNNIAVQTIKAAARGLWGKKTRSHTTWYEPLNDQNSLDKAIHWVMGQTDAFLITTGDVKILPKFLAAVGNFVEPPSKDEMNTLVKEQGLVTLFDQ